MRAKSVEASLKFKVTPSAPPANMPDAIPDPEAAKRGGEDTTAGKYGVKNTSGRIRAEAPPRHGRQRQCRIAANPMLRSGDGWDIPRQPLPELVDHIFHAPHQPISESKIRPTINAKMRLGLVLTNEEPRREFIIGPRVALTRWRLLTIRIVMPGTSPGMTAFQEAPGNACVGSAGRGYTEDNIIQKGETSWDGWTARSRLSPVRQAA